MELYSEVMSRVQNIKIWSYTIALLSQLGFFTQARLLQENILLERNQFLLNF
ncbi:hypothetical protein QUA32_00155 [Microcoleus sp. Pol14D6]|uniref:hypothetical protein n=1 Tax=Microcoleus sp. Pol14D5 TaxID=3055401 RepID=UPI002FCF3E75